MKINEILIIGKIKIQFYSISHIYIKQTSKTSKKPIKNHSQLLSVRRASQDRFKASNSTTQRHVTALTRLQQTRVARPTSITSPLDDLLPTGSSASSVSRAGPRVRGGVFGNSAVDTQQNNGLFWEYFENERKFNKVHAGKTKVPLSQALREMHRSQFVDVATPPPTRVALDQFDFLSPGIIWEQSIMSFVVVLSHCHCVDRCE